MYVFRGEIIGKNRVGFVPAAAHLAAEKTRFLGVTFPACSWGTSARPPRGRNERGGFELSGEARSWSGWGEKRKATKKATQREVCDGGEIPALPLRRGEGRKSCGTSALGLLERGFNVVSAPSSRI